MEINFQRLTVNRIDEFINIAYEQGCGAVHITASDMGVKATPHNLCTVLP